MRATVIRRFGDAGVFEQLELPQPVPAPHELLVRVKATSVNPVDYKIRSGALPDLAPAFPAVLHGDVAGVVESVGQDVKGFQPGDAVYGCAGGLVGFSGALADYMTGDATLFAHKPASLSFRESAALPLVGITAWEGIERANVRAGQSVLVYGGTGGVGHLALQLAKLRGAQVTVTVANDEKGKIARSLGADAVIDYRTETADHYVSNYTANRGFDVVFDTVGNEHIAEAFAVSRLNGQVVAINSLTPLNLIPLHVKGLSLHLVFMLIPLLHHTGRTGHGHILENLAQLVDAGQLRPLVDERRFGFDDVGRAHSLAESGSAIGKVVIEIDA